MTLTMHCQHNQHYPPQQEQKYKLPNNAMHIGFHRDYSNELGAQLDVGAPLWRCRQVFIQFLTKKIRDASLTSSSGRTSR